MATAVVVIVAAVATSAAVVIIVAAVAASAAAIVVIVAAVAASVVVVIIIVVVLSGDVGRGLRRRGDGLRRWRRGRGRRGWRGRSRCRGIRLRRIGLGGRWGRRSDHGSGRRGGGHEHRDGLRRGGEPRPGLRAFEPGAAALQNFLDSGREPDGSFLDPRAGVDLRSNGLGASFLLRHDLARRLEQASEGHPK
jgi:hypothetical protein